MKKTLLLIVSALALFNFGAKAQTYTDQATSVNWVLNSNPPAQAVVAPEEAFSSTAIAAGANLPFLDTRTTTGVTYLRVQPSAQIESPNATHAITFTIIPSAGLTFTPTNISFATYRYGTDGGSVKVTGKKASDAAETELVAEFKPNRDNSGSPTEINQSISGIAVAGEAWTVTLYVYSLGNTKQIGLSNFIISGTVNGTRQQITQYTITASVNPEGAGSITLTPPAAQYDENTVVTLATSKNFGYQFVNWTDGSGNTLSAATSFQHTVTSNIAITANYTAIPVYELNVDVQGGAKEYMISYSPQPTVLNNKKMYEDGVNVTLTAENRPILLFTNWENGETSPERTVAMTENRDITAIYAVQDYVAGWDFHYAGNGSRSADFYSTTENQAATLVLRNAAGGTQSWLDKSTVAAGGYEGRPAAVNWKNLSDNYYYQLSFNAADFQNLSIRSAMLYNYNAYSVQKLEYSLNGTDFTQIGQFTMTAEKVWYDETFALPADANNAPVVYIRWIPDYASALVGTNSTNDGTSLSGIYIFGSEAIVNDGTPPVLVSSIPANNATGVSATGRIVLTFDEKVKVAEGTTGSIEMTGNHPAIDLPVYGQVITPAVSGKTITFSYSGLAYNTEYDFVLPANTVSDLGDNVLTSPINIHFTTINRPTVTKKTFDFVVGRDGNFAAALAAANAAQAGGQRFYIFFPDGEYNIGEQTGDANQMTTINIGNLSLVGQSADNTVIYNRSINEAIGTTATVWFSNKQSGNNYLQDLSILNKADYRTGTLTGRHVALRDQSKKAIYKNVNLLSNQDTYYTGDDRSYWENGEIHGTVDFICGGGDIFFNETLLYLEERTGNCITAPATSGNWGYVFSNCTIDGFVVNNNGYRLGRSWQNVPKAVYL
ncbi:MAG: Ig-like domain-containing protein, partial [Paludibacter sp.]|nr:Ig-like domain-containing protein [Paludibacter sp.]